MLNKDDNYIAALCELIKNTENKYPHQISDMLNNKYADTLPVNDIEVNSSAKDKENEIRDRIFGPFHTPELKKWLFVTLQSETITPAIPYAMMRGINEIDLSKN